ncbi:MAG: toxin-antitoxin system HicB family antitoxin [Zetaproteobacteria bacterium]|nr:toxin-antitoxin system HicB family antitoxin [Zetaproteobacteria bacterium]MDD9952427.1 toxin-antitoxin system HicB family antitoxin [Zetaproteobacteria bacterium]
MARDKTLDYSPEDYLWTIYKDTEPNAYGEYDVVLKIVEFEAEFRFDSAAEAEQSVTKIVASLIDARIHTQKLDLPIPVKHQKEFSGKFLVRIKPETHRKLYIEAQQNNTSLNSIVEARLSAS